MSDNLLMTAMLPHPPIIIPEVGGKEVVHVEKTSIAFDEISERILELNPDTIVVITPHSVFNPYYFSIYSGKTLKGDFSNFRAPQTSLEFENDLDFVEKLMTECPDQIQKISEHVGLDHGTCVPLYFLQKAGYKGGLVSINYSALSKADHLNFGEQIKNCMEKTDKKFVFIASGDLSHRLTENAPAGYEPDAKQFDMKIVEGIERGDYESIIQMDPIVRETAGECGYNSLMCAFGLLGNKPGQNKVYSYEAPFGVGYIVASL